jgi:hypothetical protein
MSSSAEGSGASRRQSRESSATYDYPQGAGAHEEGRARIGVGIGRGLAGFLLILNGLYGFLVGLAAVVRGGFFVVHNGYAYHWSIHGWGWLQLIIGCVLFAAGVCVLLGMVWARVLGAILAGFSAITSFMFIPYYPLWSIVVIAIDVFIVWALVSSGRRQPA